MNTDASYFKLATKDFMQVFEVKADGLVGKWFLKAGEKAYRKLSENAQIIWKNISPIHHDKYEQISKEDVVKECPDILIDGEEEKIGYAKNEKKG